MSASPRRGRPRDPEKLRNIMQMAGLTFLEHGFGEATMDLVASRAGVSKVTLYNYFPSKLALFEACVRQRTTDRFDGFDSERENATQPERVLVVLAQRFLALMRDPEVLRLMGMLHGLSHQHPEVCAAFYEAGPRWVLNQVKHYLLRAQAEGCLTLSDPDLATELFLGLLMGPTHHRGLLGVAFSNESHDTALIHAAVDLFLMRYGNSKLQKHP